MAYEEKLERAIETLTGEWPDLEKKRMFGGLCYLTGGNMCFGIWKDFLIVRCGARKAAELLEKPYIRPFDITGRVMKGWVMVGAEEWSVPGRMHEWLLLGKDFTLTLPPKKP